MDNLLSKIQENVFLLANECKSSAPALEIVETLNETAKRGSVLMQQLLAFARKSEAHLTWVDLRQLVRETSETLETLLPRDVKLTQRLNKNFPHLFADPVLLNRMLTNLILNARNALPHAGRITVSAELVRFDPIPEHFTELEDVPYVCLSVVDDGIGMDEATRLRVFEPYFTTKPQEDSTGLGLPEVFGLMRTHNGLIDIQSEAGLGTTVSLFFPLPRNSVVASEQVQSRPPLQMPEAIVLL